MSGPTIGEVVELAAVETVVRLNSPGCHLDDLVLTGDVVDSLKAVLADASGSTGGGFFVVGPFGSGKSHFLAAVGELVADGTAASRLPGWDARLRSQAAAARASLTVAVPLVEYRAEARLEDVVAGRATRALPTGSMAAGTDRTATWDGLVASAHADGHTGVVILLDELSEFLRAKQGAELTEDLRFLQFLGEWARTRPVLVVAALQESIEEVANVSQRELARIRDRYRPSLTLSMRHVEDLVHGRLVTMRPGAETLVARAQGELDVAFPAARVDAERFARCYPLHPATLDLLQGLRFLLSQQRGVVDFVCSRLREALERPYDQLLTPDEVYDHFRDRLHERQETAGLADTVVPYFERAAPELVDEVDVDLALRAVKLCTLLAASPLERPRTAQDLAGMLQAKVSAVDPAANVAYLDNAVLAPLARSGAYLVADPGPPATYRVEASADAALVSEGRVAQARADTNLADRRIVATLARLGSSPAVPLHLLTDVGTARRELLWQNTLRSVLVATGRVLEMAADDVEDLASRAEAASAGGSLLVSEVEVMEGGAASDRAKRLTDATDRLVIWVPAAPTAPEQSTMLDLHAKAVVAEAAQRSGDDEVGEVLTRSADSDAAIARELVRRLYFEGDLVVAGTSVDASTVDLPSLAGVAFERQLSTLVDPLLSARHPLHRQVAPRRELVGERLVRRLVHEIIAVGRLSPTVLARGQLVPLVDAYLVPLGLARRRAEGVTVGAEPAKSLAAAELLRLVGDAGPVDATDVTARLAAGPLGLTGPESVLVLNVCVQAGLVELRRGRARLGEPFVAVSDADRLYPGELVDTAVRSTCAELAPITGGGPFEPWSTSVQRAAWHAARSWLEARREDLAQARAGLAAVREIPALGGADTDGVVADARRVAGVVDACPLDSSPAEGLRRLTEVVSDGGALIEASERLSSVSRFLRDDLRRLDEAAAYITHPDLSVPEADTGLVVLHGAALGVLADTFTLAASGRREEIFATLNELRGAYAAAYAKGHDRFYARGAVAPDEPVRSSPAYQALVALSAIGAVAVPDDRVKVDRALAAARPKPCPRRVDVELMWKPVCTCGYTLGDQPPVLDAAALVAMAERGVSQYLAELSRPDNVDRLGRAADDLEALGRERLAPGVRALSTLATAPPGREVSEEVARVLSGPAGADMASLLDDVLTGSQLIVARDLADLREDLIGRRYPKRRLLELLEAWVDPGGDLPGAGFVEVVDRDDASPSTGRQPTPVRSQTEDGGGDTAMLDWVVEHFPSLGRLLPVRQGTDAFWLAAWWGDRPCPPAWLPPPLVAEGDLLADAVPAAVAEPAARQELAGLDARIRPGSVLGDEVGATLALGDLPTPDVAAVLSGETLLRHPLRLAADQILTRIAGDWQLANRIAPSGGADLAKAVADRHALVAADELAALAWCLDAARHLAELERRLPGASGAELVSELYPDHGAAVPALLSRADAAAESPRSLVDPAAVDAVGVAARRLLRATDARLAEHVAAGFPGSMTISDIGRSLVAPLLAGHGRVAVVLIDAMRADLALAVASELIGLLPRRRLRQHWAVVPAPTRTVEAVAALSTGQPVPAGAAGEHPDPAVVPFAHLGYEAATVLGADRDHNARQLRELWTSGPPISVAVVTGVDERVHRTSADVAALLDDACAGLRRRILPSLEAISETVPIVVLADHGFRENPAWGRGPEGRYTHGGVSLEECVVPVMVLTASEP